MEQNAWLTTLLNRSETSELVSHNISLDDTFHTVKSDSANGVNAQKRVVQRTTNLNSVNKCKATPLAKNRKFVN